MPSSDTSMTQQPADYSGQRPGTTGPWLTIIGPAGAGKSTLGKLLGDLVGKAFVDIDIAGRPFYLEKGWPVARIYEESDRLGWVVTERAWEGARAHAVLNVLPQSPGGIVALGAAHTNYTRDDLFDQVQQVVATSEHIIWVEPHEDPRHSIEALRERNKQVRGLDYLYDGHDMLAEWVLDARSKSLATSVHYTRGLTPPQSVREIIQLLR